MTAILSNFFRCTTPRKLFYYLPCCATTSPPLPETVSLVLFQYTTKLVLLNSLQWVAVEAETLGTRADGKIYNNRYHYLVIVRDGMICERREYLDTIHANELLCEPLG